MYQKPKVEYLGTLRDLTRQNKVFGVGDGFFLNGDAIMNDPGPGQRS